MRVGDLSGERTLGDDGARAAGGKWTLAPGAELGGYRVVKPLGRGGMGEVYLAENVQTGVQFALKLLPSDLASDVGFRERFRREAAVLQTLRHDGIVMVHHAAEEGGRFFLTMDYVDGGSLEDRLRGGSERGHAAGVERRGPVSGGPAAARPADASGRSVSPEALVAPGRLSEAETARIALELCDALAYAHGKGVIHRDIKPANVLLGTDGRAKLSDFGLARVVGDQFLKSMTERSISLSMARTDRGAGLSQSDNAVIGTYEYMAPEQKAGAPADERSDIFALGLMVYRMLTGEKAEGRFPDPSKVGCSASWDGIVDKTLSPKPDGRYASVPYLAADVREAGKAVAAAGAARRAAEERERREKEAVARGRRDEERERATGGDTLRRERGHDRAEGPFVSPEARRPVRGTRTDFANDPKSEHVPPAPRSRKGRVAVILLLVLGGGVTAAVLGIQRRVPHSPIATYEGAGALTFDFGGGVTMELVLIPAGEFTMGSPEDEEGRSDDEGPQHRVRITKPFYMGEHEVTQAQYQAVIGTNPSCFKGSDLPVEQVSWSNATEFCRRFSQRVRKQVRLPTEAEWEYACRAGTTTRYCFGDSDGGLGEYVCYDGKPGGKTHAVGGKGANAWGLHDMHGNVWEWCGDWHGPYAAGAASDPTGPMSGSYRVLRGGRWNDGPLHCRSAARAGRDPAFRSSDGGFRVAVELQE